MNRKQSVTRRRTGDTVQIPGDYQHRALTEGSKVQRFWHYSKIQLLEWLFPVKSGMHILDVGSGSGVFADCMAGMGATIVGIDANSDAVSYANRTFKRENITFLEGYLDKLDFDDNSFDAVTCLEVVEHVYPEQVRILLTDIFRILRPGGRLLVTTPNYRGLWPIVEYVADNFSSVAKMDMEQRVTHFYRSMFISFLEDAGFSIVQCRTYSTFAPFAAIISWKVANKLENLERQIDIPFGNLLAAVVIKKNK